MAKVTFTGYVDKEGLRYNPESIPYEIRKKLIEVFIRTNYRKQQSELYNTNLLQKLNNTD